KARRRASNTPLSSHCRRRRQQVVALPYRDGNSLQGAPVQRIQRMPFETAPRISPRAASSRVALLTGQLRPNPLPLPVGEASPCPASHAIEPSPSIPSFEAEKLFWPTLVTSDARFQDVAFLVCVFRPAGHIHGRHDAKVQAIRPRRAARASLKRIRGTRSAR